MSARNAARNPQDAATITAGLLALLTALDGMPPGSPGSSAYTAALRRRGEDLAVAGGVEALRAAHAAAVDAAPDRAEARAAVLEAAWKTIPGWTD